MLSPWQFQKDTNTATCWGPAHAYRALFNIIQCSKGKERENKLMSTAATLTPGWALQFNQKTNQCWYQLPLYRRRNKQKIQFAW